MPFPAQQFSRRAARIAPVLVVAGTLALTLSGCGGGGGSTSTGGGGGGPEPCPGLDPGCTPGDYETSEYLRQGGLSLVGASSMYARGGTGKGITVGVVDTGASPGHPDLNYDSVRYGRGDTDGIDRDGHGTHVAGIIAGQKNGSGMHGVAYEASIASFALIGRGLVDEDAAISNSLDQMLKDDVFIVNNSWGRPCTSGFFGPGCLITEFRRDDIELTMPEALDAGRRYVNAGGVLVWAAGNYEFDEVLVQAGLPHLFSELEKGWLAVVAVDENGELASYSQHCGVAADWCLAAPGGGHTGIWSTVPGGGYDYESGTSMAAPHVAGAIAALKSLFPNLSYQDIRDRILFTADSSGRYAYAPTYGHGLLDLDAASRPVGGTTFALGAHDTGTVVTTDGALVALPSAAISRYLADRTILILDNYQRAPFEVPISTFASAGAAYLSLSDLDLETPERDWDDRGEAVVLAVAADDFRARGVSNGTWFSGAGQGAQVMKGMANLVGAPLPHGHYRMAEDAVGVALSFASEEGTFYTRAATGAADPTDPASAVGFGIVGWSPETVLTASFVPSGGVETFGASVASELERPMGWAGAGALEMSGDNVELAYGRNIAAGQTYRLGVASRLTHLGIETSPLVRFDDALLATAELDLSVRLARDTMLNARLGTERPVASSNGSIRVASSIDEDGRIEYDDISINGSDLLTFDKAGLSLGYAYGSNTSFGAGVAAVRDGFGETEAIAGARAEVRF